MDINKEREAFESWAYSKKWNISRVRDHYVDDFVNGAWHGWQAKAQAVPEGFVLVPKEPTQDMLDSARDWSTKKYGKAVGNDGAYGCYKAMIEAQEPAND